MNPFLADIVLIVHFLFVAFVVGGLALIWVGAASGWAWVRNFWFRVAHLAAIVFVAGEALVGVWCPLTVWEDALRGVHGDKSFVARWIEDPGHAVAAPDPAGDRLAQLVRAAEQCRRAGAASARTATGSCRRSRPRGLMSGLSSIAGSGARVSVPGIAASAGGVHGRDPSDGRRPNGTCRAAHNATNPHLVDGCGLDCSGERST